MIQQILALIIVLFFLVKLFSQKGKKQINNVEFTLLMMFWLLVILLIVFIKKIDIVVSKIGFSGSGIEVLLYLSIAVLFYAVFKLYINYKKQEKEITKIVREISLLKKYGK